MSLAAFAGARGGALESQDPVFVGSGAHEVRGASWSRFCFRVVPTRDPC